MIMPRPLNPKSTPPGRHREWWRRRYREYYQDKFPTILSPHPAGGEGYPLRSPNVAHHYGRLPHPALHFPSYGRLLPPKHPEDEAKVEPPRVTSSPPAGAAF